MIKGLPEKTSDSWDIICTFGLKERNKINKNLGAGTETRETIE